MSCLKKITICPRDKLHLHLVVPTEVIISNLERDLFERNKAILALSVS